VLISAAAGDPRRADGGHRPFLAAAVEAAITALRSAGAAVLLITHEEALARQADAASQICGGRIVCSDAPERVVERYKHRICSRCDGAICHV